MAAFKDMYQRKHRCTTKHALHSQVSQAIINAHQHCTQRTKDMLARAEKESKIRKRPFKVIHYCKRDREQVLASWDEPSRKEVMKDILDRCYELEN